MSIISKIREFLKIPPPRNGNKLYPESYSIVIIDGDLIRFIDYSNNESIVSINDLTSVSIITTSGGPFVPDVFWELKSDKNTLIIPLVATGEETLLEKMQKLDNFDNEMLIAAATCLVDKEFLCWQRTNNS